MFREAIVFVSKRAAFVNTMAVFNGPEDPVDPGGFWGVFECRWVDSSIFTYFDGPTYGAIGYVTTEWPFMAAGLVSNVDNVVTWNKLSSRVILFLDIDLPFLRVNWVEQFGDGSLGTYWRAWLEVAT